MMQVKKRWACAVRLSALASFEQTIDAASVSSSSRTGATMPRQWEFSGSSEGWYWRAMDAVTGAVVLHARSCFAHLSDCVRDAELQGYRRSAVDKHTYRVGWLPHRPRRPTKARVRDAA
jgi:hypothetical protein